MFRLTPLRPAIVLCFFLYALQSRGVKLYPTTKDVTDSLAQDVLRGSAKLSLTSLKSNSIEAIIFGQGSSSWNEAYFAGHQTPSSGPDDTYYGLHVTIDVYDHELKRGQLSSTTFWIFHDGDGNTSSLNSIQVGWHIHPDHYGDSHPHFYTSWTRDGDATTGCLNMECPGFIKVSGAVIAPGDTIHPVDHVPGGPIQNITLRVNKDKKSGDWWVYYGFNNIPTGVGYFPKSLFNYLAKKATRVAFGAYVSSKKGSPTPPMGSGARPNGSMGRAASFTDLRFMDKDGNSSPIMADLPKTITNEKCHSITPIDHANCLYGGPGGCIR
ncbi:hypothetical protein ACQ4PT_007981 [Festuca glaucescens]